jgi:F-type H+-transporting ATPase subunit b
MPRHTRLALALALGLGLVLAPPSRLTRAAEPDAHHAPAAGSAADHGHEAAAEGEAPILQGQPSLAIWTLVVFIGLLLLLRRFAWTPLLNALQQREEHLEHVLLDTERARNEAEGLLAEHRRLMTQAQDKIRAMLTEARHEADSASADIVRKAQEEAEAARHRAERDIATARDQALVEIWSKAAELSVSVAGKVLERELGPEEHRRLIATALEKLPSAPDGRQGVGVPA